MLPSDVVDERLIGRFVDMRLTIEMARRRARMYLADPASDRAVNAEQALVEVLGLLEGVDVGTVDPCETCGSLPEVRRAV